jgi:hypothetical protein
MLEYKDFQIANPSFNGASSMTENNLKNDRLLLIIILGAVIGGGAIYIASKNREIKIIKADLQKQEKPTD